ncbi:MAG: hypothetical protein QOE48_983 [Mycobacterium sp.]|jgi:hypothetical protein|nr:hypothetical protein [Mycobacterium sp.]MDT5305315.1 hypothetical protein [Mycobacterium sp.]
MMPESLAVFVPRKTPLPDLLTSGNIVITSSRQTDIATGRTSSFRPMFVAVPRAAGPIHPHGPGDAAPDAMATARVRRQDVLYQPGRRIELILG